MRRTNVSTPKNVFPEGVVKIELTATKLRTGRYAISPKGCLGTCGSIGGKLWTVQYVNRIPKGMKIEG